MFNKREEGFYWSIKPRGEAEWLYTHEERNMKQSFILTKNEQCNGYRTGKALTWTSPESKCNNHNYLHQHATTQ